MKVKEIDFTNLYYLLFFNANLSIVFNKSKFFLYKIYNY